MSFLGIGGGEIILILVVALLIFGPGRFIEVSRNLGKTIRDFKKATSDLSSKINKEIEEQKTGSPPDKNGMD